MSLVSTEKAISLLESQQVVGLPTETVYGLAGIIDSDKALNKIFATKARPFYDPLIVHVKSVEQALNLGHWDPLSQKLATHFWPGPLTLVVPKQDQISDLITSGGHTVAFRQPNHPLFLEILEKLNKPLAAPSANMFGQTSPTTAEHVVKEFNQNVPVVDGGSCQKGIESTVIEVDPKKNLIKILRPGFIGKKELQKFLNDSNESVQIESTTQENAPGHLKNHYQPSSPLFLIFDGDTAPDLLIDLMSREINQSVQPWILPDEPSLAARNLYKDLRHFSEKKQAAFLVIKKQWHQVELWTSLLDRLKKASHYWVTAQEDKWLIQEKNSLPSESK